MQLFVFDYHEHCAPVGRISKGMRGAFPLVNLSAKLRAKRKEHGLKPMLRVFLRAVLKFEDQLLDALLVFVDLTIQFNSTIDLRGFRGLSAQLGYFLH